MRVGSPMSMVPSLTAVSMPMPLGERQTDRATRPGSRLKPAAGSENCGADFNRARDSGSRWGHKDSAGVKGQHPSAAECVGASTACGPVGMQFHWSEMPQSMEELPAATLTPPHPSDRRLEPHDGFEVDQEVQYWSHTHSQWMDAVVVHKTLDNEGWVYRYHLDVKRSAHPENVRARCRDLHRPEEAFSIEVAQMTGSCHRVDGLHSTDALAQLLSEVSSLAEVPLATLRLAVGGRILSWVHAWLPLHTLNIVPGCALAIVRASEPPSYADGEHVEYWSDTHSMWLQSKVMTVHGDPAFGLYDLEVKRGAPWWKIRRPLEKDVVITHGDGRRIHSSENPVTLMQGNSAMMAEYRPTAAGTLEMYG
eukprot:gnl/TRDRNA2_/TRDRNA2_43798_c0_seq1.p1 gnl/TRDRNA2_/TRDRNA2_43798_c0~~gnl/TRDRNA2_/TRDRNA2_43798_c0_seq1.p1  ORF type:complete len:365 (+),score=36.96 gnl/TRDRNA2_/TRDRNA2_43798_c0_seq1:64-1158(+)